MYLGAAQAGHVQMVAVCLSLAITSIAFPMREVEWIKQSMAL